MAVLQPADWPRPRGFSHGVTVDAPGRWVVLAGQTGHADDDSYPDDIAAQIKIALERIHAELGDRLEALTTAEDRDQFYQCVLEVARRSQFEQPRILRKDILGGIAVGLLILVATLPILVPFLLVSNATTAVRLSNLITLVMLFGIGWWWGRVVGANPLRIGAGVMAFGLALVLITIALGG